MAEEQKDIIEELLSDAILVQRFGQRTGAFEDDALVRAIVLTHSGTRDWTNPGLVALSGALNEGLKCIKPVTLVELREWDPFAGEEQALPGKNKYKKYAFIATAVALLFVCGYYTSWQKRATKLLDETASVVALTQSNLINDMVYFYSESGGDLANPTSVAKVPFRAMVDELRETHRKMNVNIAENTSLDEGFVPLLGLAKSFAGQVFGVAASTGNELPTDDCKFTGQASLAADSSGSPVDRVRAGVAEYDMARRDILCLANLNPGAVDAYLKRNWVHQLGSRIDLMSAWILPALYGALGAMMFYLRDFLNRLRPDPGFVAVAVRIALGLFAGISVGWFAAPTTLVQGIGISDLSLATLSLAFLVGFGIDVFFTFLDRLLEVFRGSVSKIGVADKPMKPATSPA